MYKAFLTGAIVGAAVGMMVVPELGKGTANSIKKLDQMVMGMAGNAHQRMRKR